MKHNELFSIIKNKKDWRHCKSGKLSAEWDIYEEGDIVYILFQETDGVSDWIQNLSFTKRRYGKLKFHHGLYELYDLMRDEVIDFVKNIPSNKTLVVSGWSQGAAIAQICVQDIYFHTGRKSLLISFGAPMAIYGRKTRKACRESVIEAFEYCNKSDIVTYQPPFLYWHHIKRVNVGSFGIFKIFKPTTYHTNYNETVPSVDVEKTIKTKEKEKDKDK